MQDEKLLLRYDRARRIITGVNHELAKRKKIKAFLSICLLLWVATGAQLVAERIFRQQAELTEAFINSNTTLNESMVEVSASYLNSYLTEADKIDLVRYVAQELKIEVNLSDISVIKQENKEVVSYIKTAKRAETTIKCITLDGEYSKTGAKEYYLFVRIRINEDVNDDVIEYQKRIQKIFEKLNTIEISNTLQFSGNFAGKLTLEELNSMANQMIHNLGGKVIYENRELDLYTVYAYSSGIEEFISVDGLKINIQVASTYNEEEDKTKIYLATPIISGDW